MGRKEMRGEARLRAAKSVASRKERKIEIREMPRAERKLARHADRQARKQQRAAWKKEMKELPRSERRRAKRMWRMEKRARNRNVRLVSWSAAGVVLVLVGVWAAPYIADVRTLLSIRVDSDTPAGENARERGETVAEEISDQGIVLLENRGGVLPLKNDRVNVFGFDSFNMRFGGGGSGSADQSRSVGLYDALGSAGIEYNQQLREKTAEEGAESGSGPTSGAGQILAMVTGKGTPRDPSPTYLSDAVMDEAAAYSDTALVVFGNDGVEMKDFTPSELRLSEHQIELLEKVTERIPNVIIVINSGNTMELGFLEEYPEIKAALNVGTAGPRAAVSLTKVLLGEVNPSGRLTDTYAYSNESSPAAVNFGDFKYENAKRGFLNYAEGIYVGYRFYETYYEEDETAYRNAVQYPFGYGLSYTEFEWETGEPTITEDEELSLSVRVTNTGDIPGRDVVQLYYRAPYTLGGIEKPAVALAGFAKTEEIAPGESDTVTIQFPMRQMASWDTTGGGRWVLEEGDYGLQVSTDVHSPVFDFTIPVPTTLVYDRDEETGEPLKNQFSFAEGNVTYLSRANWEKTYPVRDDIDYEASQEVLEQMAASPLPETDVEVGPVVGAENGIVLADMVNLEYDDPAWDLFLDQFTVPEMKKLFSNGGYHTVPIERLGIPGATLLDGPAGISFFFGDVKAASYPTAVVIASTWNEELARKLGESAGEEANAYGVTGWYAPGMNIHRSALGGRNFEYYSEDPLLSGVMGAAITGGAQEKGVITTQKHFLLNDQETNARTGVNIWANEQSLREIYLRPFEITTKTGSPTGAMSSFVHLGTEWAGANPQLLQNVLRDEWGFTGVVSTDAVLGGFMDIQAAALHGSDLMLDPLPTRNAGKLNAAYKKVPNAISWGLRDRVHNICYALANSSLMR